MFKMLIHVKEIINDSFPTLNHCKSMPKAARFALFIAIIFLSENSIANKGAVLFDDPKYGNYMFPVFDLGTKKTSKRNLTFSQDTLNELQVTLEQLKKAWVEVLPNGKEDLVIQGKRLELLVQPNVYEIYDVSGKHAFSMNLEGFKSLTMKNIEGDRTLIPSAPPRMKWELPSRCFLGSISISLTKDSVELKINGVRTIEYKAKKENASSDNWLNQGLLISVINPVTCKATLDFVASTSDVTGYRDLLWGLDSILPGKLVLIASLRDGAAYLSEKARSIFVKLGSLWGPFFLYRDAWLNLFVKGGKTAQEILLPNLANLTTSGSPFTLHFDASRLIPRRTNECFLWPETRRWKARRVFCDSHDGYPDLCDCEMPLEFRGGRRNEIVKLPILIMAGNRTRHLYRLLRSLKFQEHITRKTLMLVSDGYIEDVGRLAFILDLKWLIHRPEGIGVVKISRNLRFTLYNGLHSFPRADAFIVLEDDLVLSPDFYSYMIHMKLLFQMDPTVFCVSAFNHLSFPHTSQDPALAYRVRAYPAYGWMMPRTILEEVVPKWLPENVTVEWDFFFGFDFVMKGRECIVPDINRSYHWNTKGIHSDQSRYNAEVLYLLRNINQNPHVVMRPIQRLIQKNYEKEFRNLMASSIPIHLKSRSEFDEIVSEGKTYAVYLFQKKKNDDASFRLFSLVFEMWTSDVRDHHNFAWRFFYKNATIMVVGVPISPYRVYMPPHFPVLRGKPEAVNRMLQENEFIYKTNHQAWTHKGANYLPFFHR